MKIKCIATLRKDLNQSTRDVLITRDFELPVGKKFTVYGISIWHGVLHYLIVEDIEWSPSWIPAELFIVEDTILPKETHHKYFGLQDPRGVNALWGYKEMVFDDHHYGDLMESEKIAVEIFLKRKREIDGS
jgi:hypothetical protein